jgi:hypothetical protein
MMGVKRYNPEGMRAGFMSESSDGSYVLYDDYAALEKAYNEALEEVRNRHSCDGEYICDCGFCREEE